MLHLLKAEKKEKMVTPDSLSSTKGMVLLGSDIIQIKRKSVSRDNSKSKKIVRINRDSINFEAVSPIKSP